MKNFISNLKIEEDLKTLKAVFLKVDEFNDVKKLLFDDHGGRAVIIHNTTIVHEGRIYSDEASLLFLLVDSNKIVSVNINFVDQQFGFEFYNENDFPAKPIGRRVSVAKALGKTLSLDA